MGVAHLFQLHPNADVLNERVAIDEKDAGSARLSNHESAFQRLRVTALHFDKRHFRLSSHGTRDRLFAARSRA